MDLIKLCNKIITYSFYVLFFLVPLVFVGTTSELFEFNKMWLTFGFTIVIMTAWICKMILQKQVKVQKTPLDWFILAFFVSQTISTLFSLDSRVSLWGYYSRFNGGLLSLLAYVLLYYAFVTHFKKEQVKTFLLVNVLSGLVVALWGLPSHFGKDPTCLVFRGQFNVDCWTEAFKPTIRMFSTLGQPAWLAAYMAALIPVSVAMLLQHLPKRSDGKINFPMVFFFGLTTVLFYACLLYANTRAGFLGFWLGNGIMWAVVAYKKLLPRRLIFQSLIAVNLIFFVLNFFIGTPIAQLDTFSYRNLMAQSQPASPQSPASNQNANKQPANPAPNITDSSDIRLHVWRGAVDAWKDSPIIGTGVETFAFAYYKHRPEAHNLTSEWDYLYNKAHNEYLNYLTTTGVLGLGTYVAVICMICFLLVTFLFFPKKLTDHQREEYSLSEEHDDRLMVAALLGGFITILVTNFFGFSIVIINMLLLILPASALLYAHLLPAKRYKYPLEQEKITHFTVSQHMSCGVVILIALYFLWSLMIFWEADKAYALGSNLDSAGEYQTAYPLLQNAVSMYASEPVFKDELSYNSAQLAIALYQAQQATPAAELAQQAVTLSDDVLTNHPNNIVFWKTRVRIFYTLSQLDQRYLPFAISAAEQASRLAPTDAKISWNLGVLYGQNGEMEKAITTLQKTIKLRPNYVDAYYALGLFYHDDAVDENDKVIDQAKFDKAVEMMRYVLENLDPNNEQVKAALEQWNVK